jgi:hypothetical protein
MSDHWTDRLSDYLDGDLAAGERAALDAHLIACAECRTTLGELRRVVARARALEDAPPRADLWPAIAERIGTATGRPDVPDLGAHRARRISFTLPQLAAAGIALMLVSSGVVWRAMSRGEGPVATSPSSPVAPDGALAAWSGKEPHDQIIARLELLVTQEGSALDTATVRVLKKNLEIIDRAIAEARAALAADPASTYLNHHLARTMRRKVDLLRQASALAGAGRT